MMGPTPLTWTPLVTILLLVTVVVPGCDAGSLWRPAAPHWRRSGETVAVAPVPPARSAVVGDEGTITKETAILTGTYILDDISKVVMISWSRYLVSSSPPKKKHHRAKNIGRLIFFV